MLCYVVRGNSYVYAEENIAFVWTVIDIFYFRDAYKVACLGVTEGDWRALAMEALEVNFVAFLVLCAYFITDTSQLFVKSVLLVVDFCKIKCVF